jgi:hypothetical protein
MGRQLHQHYRETSVRAAEIVSEDPALLDDTAELFLVAGAFTGNLLAVEDGDTERHGREKLDDRYFRDARNLLARFRRRAPGREFNQALGAAERAIPRLEGKTAAGMVDELKRD